MTPWGGHLSVDILACGALLVLGGIISLCRRLGVLRQGTELDIRPCHIVISSI